MHSITSFHDKNGPAKNQFFQALGRFITLSNL